jgi:integrase
VCHEFILHRFRKNFATMHHHNGVSVRSIQKWLRHSSLETTLRYLAGEEDKGPEMRKKINGTFAAFAPKLVAVAA